MSTPPLSHLLTRMRISILLILSRAVFSLIRHYILKISRILLNGSDTRLDDFIRIYANLHSGTTQSENMATEHGAHTTISPSLDTPLVKEEEPQGTNTKKDYLAVHHVTYSTKSGEKVELITHLLRPHQQVISPDMSLKNSSTK